MRGRACCLATAQRARSRFPAHLGDHVVQVAERRLTQQPVRQRRLADHPAQGLLRPPHHRLVHSGGGAAPPPPPPPAAPSVPGVPRGAGLLAAQAQAVARRSAALATARPRRGPALPLSGPERRPGNQPPTLRASRDTVLRHFSCSCSCWHFNCCGSEEVRKSNGWGRDGVTRGRTRATRWT